MGISCIDYGARLYDPVIGIFGGVDPLMEKYPNLSPYVYVANNPIKYIDPDGNYILPAAMAQKYSKLADYLKNGIGDLLQNQNIRSGLRLIGGFSNSQIDNELAVYGKGININLVEPSRISGASGYVPGSSPDNMQISVVLAQQLENATTYEDESAALLGIISTILHESIHNGQNGGGTRMKEDTDGAWSRIAVWDNSLGYEREDYYLNGYLMGDTEESGRAFESGIWDFGGIMRGDKQGASAKKDQSDRYYFNQIFGNDKALPKLID